jgi:hypothetical protein
MSSPKICSLEEDNPQSKPFIPSFAGMAIDDSQQCQANLTITSKLRSKFLPNTKQTVTHSKYKFSIFYTDNFYSIFSR